MKAKLKKTGEIINIAEYDMVKLDKCDSYGNPIEVDYDDVEKFYDDNDYPIGMPKFKIPSVLEVDDNIDWKQTRIQAAIAATQGFCANSNMGDNEAFRIAKWAVEQADALIEELKKEK